MTLIKPYEVTLDLYDSAAKKTSIIYYRGDRNVYPINIYLTSKKKPFEIPHQSQASLTCIRPDGSSDKTPVEITDHGNGVLKYNVVGSELSVPGSVTAVIELSAAGSTLTWQPFNFTVICASNGENPQPAEPYVLWTNEIESKLLGLNERIGEINAGSGHSPYFNGDTQSWWEFNDLAGEYVDTGLLMPGGGDLSASDISQTDSRFSEATVQGAISELFTSVSDGKTALAADIAHMGGTVPTAGNIPSFSELSSGVSSLYRNYYPILKAGVSSIDPTGTEKGVSWEIKNGSNYSDCYIVLNGTATASFSFLLFGGGISVMGRPIVIQPGSWRLDKGTDYPIPLLFFARDFATGTGYSYTTGTDTRFSVIAPGGARYAVSGSLTVEEGMVFDNVEIRPMLTKGKDEKPWKPWII